MKILTSVQGNWQTFCNVHIPARLYRTGYVAVEWVFFSGKNRCEISFAKKKKWGFGFTWLQLSVQWSG